MDAGFTEFKLTGRWAFDSENKCYANLETGDKFCSKDELLCFIDDATKETVFKKCHKKLETGSESVAKREGYEAKNTVSKQEVSNKKVHRVVCCTMCGGVGNLTSCCSFSIRKYAVKSVAKKLKSKRTGNCERGHNCYVPRGRALAPRKRRMHCSLCGKAGHNRRTCPKSL